MRLAERNAQKKAQLVAYKGGKCQDCGSVLNVDWPLCCFDFDHRDPLTKRFTIGDHLSYPLPDLILEVEKCDLVCACCHRIRTTGNLVLRALSSARRKGLGQHHRIPNQKTRIRLSQSLKGKNLGHPSYVTPEGIAKMSASKKGQIPWMAGRMHLESTKEKMSLAKKGKPWSERRRAMFDVKKKLHLVEGAS